MNEIFAENLKKCRKKLGLSVASICESTGIPVRTWTAYERSERTPSVDFCSVVSKKYNINSNWLLTGEGEMFLAQPTLKVRDEDKKITLRNFGGKINKLQTENDLSLSEAAEILEISEDDFVDYCLNRKKPDINIILKIIEKFDVNFDWFVR